MAKDKKNSTDNFTFTKNTIGTAKPKSQSAKKGISSLNSKYGGGKKK